MRYKKTTKEKENGVVYTPIEMADYVATQMIQCGNKKLYETIDVLDPAVGFRVIIMTVANSQVNIRVLEFLPKFKTKEMSSWCTV